MYLCFHEMAFPQMVPNLLRSVLGSFTVAAEAGFSLSISKLLELVQVHESRAVGIIARSEFDRRTASS